MHRDSEKVVFGQLVHPPSYRFMFEVLVNYFLFHILSIACHAFTAIKIQEILFKDHEKSFES